MSVPADKALITDPIQPLGDGIQLDTSGFANYDQSKDPTYNRLTDQATKAEQGIEGAAKQRAAMEAEQQPDQFNQTPPQTTMTPQIMQSMAPLMIFTALGGAFTKQSGMTMLGAMNGMVQGINKGDEEGRERAWQQYQDTYQKWKDKVEESHRIYEEHKAALGDTVFADQAAQKFALQMRGDEVAQQQFRAGQINKEKQLLIQQQIAHDKIKATMQKQATWTNKLKAVEDLEKVEGSFPVLQSADQAFESATESFKRVRDKYKKSKYGAIAPQSASDLMTALGNDPDVQNFQAQMGQLKSILVQVKSSLGSNARMSVYLEQMYNKGVPDFWSMSDNQIASLLTSEKNLIGNIQAQQDKHANVLREMISKMDLDLQSDQPATTVDPDIGAILGP